jgi:TPR repeat protein
MTAVSTTPPSTSHSSSPGRRKPVAAQGSPDGFATVVGGAARKPLPTVPMAHPPLNGSPRLRDAPVSPVRVNFQTESWPIPSKTNIETVSSYGGSQVGYMEYAPVLPENLVDRSLPKTPDPPPPPPHSPDYEQSKPQKTAATTVSQVFHAPRKPLPQIISSPLFSPQSTATSGDFSVEYVDALVASPESHEANGLPNGHRPQDANRRSRESDTASSLTQPHTSNESSAATSTSSVSGHNEASDSSGSPESSLVDGAIPRTSSVPLFQYHHQPYPARVASVPHETDFRVASNPELVDHGAGINRHLTPNSYHMRRSSLPRPQSAYSMYSDFGPRGRSPALYPGGSNVRAPSAQSRRSPETRPNSYAELLNVPYPQPAPAPITLDNSQLRNAVGNNASLLSTQKTLEMYRQNVKKTNDFSIQYSFAIFLISTAQEQGLNFDDVARRKNSPQPPTRGADSPFMEASAGSPHELAREARHILQRLSSAGYPFAQYYLADGYASGLFSKGKEDYNSAFPMFVLAAKHGHAESAYRTALCYEFGWGCRKDPAKAVQFLRSAASKRHPGAMTRLGKACLSGDLGEKRYREGIKWLKLATEAADTIYNAAPYQLGCLYETGYGDDIFLDESYAAELFTQAAELGHPEANYRMGDSYEHGKLNCPRDPALSVHFYTGAAERGHAGAMMGLCAWYMVGAEPILEKDEEEAYEWARRSAELGKSD